VGWGRIDAGKLGGGTVNTKLFHRNISATLIYIYFLISKTVFK